MMTYSLNRANKNKKDNIIHSVLYNFYDIYWTGRACALIKYKKYKNWDTIYR